ncbi:wavE lipopolysaccharide synthesis family protein, partial [Escherichia coli]|nr:wavE lipopolysaccharide synthesis family protein [Escherichia coli]
MMKSENITFVVQGPVRNETKDTLESIRLNFKEAKIILSTWEGSNVKGLSFDDIVFSNDPGPLNIKRGTKIVAQENTNRQIISTYQGLIKVRTPYAVKLRTDTPLRNDNIIKNYIKAQAYGRDYNFSYLEERILVSSINTIDPKSYIQFPYHISDWIYFGKTNDLLKIWDGELIDDNDYFTEQDIKEEISCKRGFEFGRYTAEQLVLYSFLKKNKISEYKHYCDTNNDRVEKVLKVILSNFYCVSPKQMGLCFDKYSDLITPRMNYRSLRSFLGFYFVTINERVWRNYYSQFYK